MRKIRDVLRLKAGGLSKRKIAASLSIGPTSVIDCLHRARDAGIGWPLPDDLTDDVLEARLYPASTALSEIKARRPQPDWPKLHRELRRKGVTLQLPWEEHRAACPAATAIAASASCTGPGKADCRQRCGRPTSPASVCSSTTRARRWR
jgi:transposase